MTRTVDEAIERGIDYEASRRDGPPPGFPPLPEIPGGRYTRADFSELELEHVWRNAWVCIGRDNDLREPGQYRSFDKLGVPMIVVRGRDLVLRAFYNTCRHRGAPVVRAEAGQVSLLRCQYHSWTYALDGRLIGVPDERDFGCLDKAERGLMQVACETWGGLVFINGDPAAPPLREALGGLGEELDCIQMEGLRDICHKSYIIDCNWKAAIDAFLEIYHINTIHPDTVAVMLDSMAVKMSLIEGGHSRMVARRQMSAGDNFSEFDGAPISAVMPDMFRRNSLAYHVFPNLIMPVDVIGFPFMIFWPRGPHQCEMQAFFAGVDWGDGPCPPFWDRYLEIFQKLLDEDLENLAPIQASLNSKAFSGMMINYQERRIYWFHEEVDRRIGAERIPPGLAVAQVLGNHVERPVDMAAE